MNNSTDEPVQSGRNIPSLDVWRKTMLTKRVAKQMTVVLMVLGLMAIPAGATLIVDIGGTVGGGVYTPGTQYTDNQAGVDVNPTLGIMDIGAFLNSIAVNFVIQSFGTTSARPTASMSMTTNANLAAAALLPFSFNIVISDTGFSLPPTPITLSQTVNLLSSVGGVTANATAVGFYGDSNTNFDVNGPFTLTSTSSVLNGIATNTPGSLGLVAGPTPYSLTTFIHTTITARGVDPIENLQINANLSAAAVPEPGTLLFMGTGMIGLSILLWRKRRRSSIPTW